MRRFKTLGLLRALLLAPALISLPPGHAAPVSRAESRPGLCAGTRLDAAALGQVQTSVRRRLAVSGRDAPSRAERSQLAHCLSKVGVLFFAIGQGKEASAVHRQALAIQLSLGPAAAEAVARQRSMLAGSLISQGEDQAAMAELEQAEAYFRAHPLAVGNASDRATVLIQMAMVLERRGQSGHALDQLQRALALQERSGDVEGQLSTLETMAMRLVSLGQIDAAEGLLPRLRHLAPGRTSLVEPVLALLRKGATGADIADPIALRANVEQARRAGLQTMTALNLEALATALGSQGDLQGALKAQGEALAIHKAMDAPQRQASLLVAIGGNQQLLGQYQQALEAYNAALVQARRGRDRGVELKSLQALASLEADLGSLESSAEHGRRALGLARAQQDRFSELLILVGLADLERQRRDPALAWQNAEDAVALADRLGMPLLQVTALTSLTRAGITPAPGEDRPNPDDPAALARLNGALQAATRIEALGRRLGRRPLIAIGAGYRARVLLARGSAAEALEPARQAVAQLRTEHNPIGLGYALDQLGRTALAVGQPALARDSQRQALSLWKAAGQQPEVAESLYQLSRSSQALGDIDTALAEAEQAVTVIEALRAGLTSQALRQSYFSRVQDPYDWWIELLMERHRRQPAAGWDAQALEVSERARARTLVELLREADAEIQRGRDFELVRRQREFRQKERLLESERQRLLGLNELGVQAEVPSDQQRRLVIVNQQLAELARQRQRLEQWLGRGNHHAEGLESGGDLLTAVAMRTLLGPGDQTVLLSFHLGPQASVLWRVDRHGVRSAPLPPRRTFEALVIAHRRALMRSDQRLEEERLARELGQRLLGPLAAELTGKRLVIVPDGALHYLPFAALIAPGSDRRLVEEHELIHLPSASALAALRQRHRRSSATASLKQRPVVVFADPIFDAADSRLSAGGRRRSTTPGANDQDPISRSASALGIAWQRLPGTAQEAAALGRLVQPQRLERHLGLAASKLQLRDLNLQRFGLVHFATHGLANARQPELSAVVLSLLDQRRQPQDGYLRLRDLYNLPLAADLVVVSACQSGLGGQIRGEGMVGLTRGFLHAGARRVITSLWNVEDKATATLMGAFYQALLVRGLPPAAALRQSQRMMIEQRHAAPYDWAAFVLHGDWP